MYLKTQIRVTSGTEMRLKQEILQELEQFRDAGILVEEVSLTRTTFNIIFLPISDIEKVMFKIKDSNVLPQQEES